MPLPNLNKQCRAKAKSTGYRCCNPAAYGCSTCRLHGARKNALSGIDHHWYKHGDRSKDGILTFREIKRRLVMLEEIGFATGLMEGKRTNGRKPR